MGISKKKYFIIDGNSFVFRAFFAMPQFTTSRGEVVNAVFGVTKMILQLLKKHKPDLLCVAFDHKGKSFRHETYEHYKAHREETPDALKTQFDPIKQIVKTLGIPLVEIEGVEADDSIATFVLLHQHEPNTEIYVVTGDKDMMQLVNDRVFIYDTMKNITYDRNGVKEKMGVFPEQIPDLLGLMGDSSDNIPGVAGIGPKTAQKLLEEYTSLDNILSRKEEIKGSVGEKIRTHVEDALMSKDLATVKGDVDLSHLTFTQTPPDIDELSRLFEHFEFRSLKRDLLELTGEKHVNTKDTSPTQDWKYIREEKSFEKIQKDILAHGSLSVSPKYTPTEDGIEHIALSTGLSSTYVCTPGEDLPLTTISDLLFSLSTKEGFLLSGHDLKHLFHILQNTTEQEMIPDSQPSLFSL